MGKRMPAAERRQSIIEAAIRQFAKYGYNGTVIRSISEEAGVNEALIYRYFSGKEELFSAALDTIIEELKERTLFREATQFGLTAETLPLLAESASKFMSEEPLTHMLLYSGLQKHELAKPFFDTVTLPISEAISGLIRDGQESGELRDDIDPFIGAITYISAIIFMNIAKNVFQHELFRAIDVREFTQTFSKIYLRGLSAAKRDDEDER